MFDNFQPFNDPFDPFHQFPPTLFNRAPPNVFPTPTSVVGTWKAVNTTVINGQPLTELAVAQFKPDGTFVEGFDLLNHASTYQGRYSFDTTSQRISFIIDSAAGDGPQPVPFHQLTQSSNVSFGNPTLVRLNNDLIFAFQSTSVSPSDFTLPPAPLAPPPITSPFVHHGMVDPLAFSPMFAPHF